jgi:hypothetical protein
MDFVSRVHDIEVRLTKVARERDERREEAEAAMGAVRFYQSREEESVASGGAASRRASLALGEEGEEEGLSPSVSPTGGVGEMKSAIAGVGTGVGREREGDSSSSEEEEEEDAEVAKAITAAAAAAEASTATDDDSNNDAASKAAAPSLSPPTSTAASAASPVGSDGPLPSLETLTSMEDDEGHQACRALHSPLERLLEEGAAFVHKHQDTLLAPLTLTITALFALGLILLLLRAAISAPAASITTTTRRHGHGHGHGSALAAAVEDAWTGAARSPLLRLTPGGPPLRAGEYLASCSAAATTISAAAHNNNDAGKGEAKAKTCYFLWNQWDGNLVLYRGFHPGMHRGPLWSTNTLVAPPREAQARRRRGGAEGEDDAAAPLLDHWGAGNVTVWLTKDRTLQLIDAPSGKVMWQRRAWRLPRELTPWPFGR